MPLPRNLDEQMHHSKGDGNVALGLCLLDLTCEPPTPELKKT